MQPAEESEQGGLIYSSKYNFLQQESGKFRQAIIAPARGRKPAVYLLDVDDNLWYCNASGKQLLSNNIRKMESILGDLYGIIYAYDYDHNLYLLNQERILLCQGIKSLKTQLIISQHLKNLAIFINPDGTLGSFCYQISQTGVIISDIRYYKEYHCRDISQNIILTAKSELYEVNADFGVVIEISPIYPILQNSSGLYQGELVEVLSFGWLYLLNNFGDLYELGKDMIKIASNIAHLDWENMGVITTEGHFYQIDCEHPDTLAQIVVGDKNISLLKLSSFSLYDCGEHFVAITGR